MSSRNPRKLLETPLRQLMDRQHRVSTPRRHHRLTHPPNTSQQAQSKSNANKIVLDILVFTLGNRVECCLVLACFFGRRYPQFCNGVRFICACSLGLAKKRSNISSEEGH